MYKIQSDFNILDNGRFGMSLDVIETDDNSPMNVIQSNDIDEDGLDIRYNKLIVGGFNSLDDAIAYSNRIITKTQVVIRHIRDWQKRSKNIKKIHNI